MEHSIRVFRNRFTFWNGKRALVLAVTFVIGLLFVLGTLFGGSRLGNTPVQAAPVFEGGATAEMLAYALNFGEASDLAVFGGRAVRNQGNSTFRGRVGSAGPVSGVPGMPEGIVPENYGQ